MSNRMRDGLAGICLGAGFVVIGLLVQLVSFEIGMLVLLFGAAGMVFGLARVGYALATERTE